MPTKRSCPITRPCECGLARPRRLFGLSMERVDGAPGSDTVFRDPDPRGLPPTITPGSLRFPTGREIQGPLAGAGPATLSRHLLLSSQVRRRAITASSWERRQPYAVIAATPGARYSASHGSRMGTTASRFAAA